ncbi:hypothetical protein MLO08_24235, partial [Escherichia coli]|nr:hypothetical protein [Escherichia coli]
AVARTFSPVLIFLMSADIHFTTISDRNFIKKGRSKTFPTRGWNHKQIAYKNYMHISMLSMNEYDVITFGKK